MQARRTAGKLKQIHLAWLNDGGRSAYIGVIIIGPYENETADSYQNADDEACDDDVLRIICGEK